ncbi:transglycosylase SLT domain-containing protein [Thermosipho atlanticus]|uniref:Transglycosylase SLT domain-containing protein n=1 Tax=Thermosipho atlanticus DSM 15807 TaxID=1123380 RepID=A0A1M5QR43_9BACT|nr:transglycosylase SLT domain-containing protein [Thermosipho atlanticus]SHH16259.1 Transglycosylase SLT domain-containing protein [Thermosipho atlanticus DSM 15807]
MKKIILFILILTLSTNLLALPGQWFRDMIKEYRASHGLDTYDEMLYEIEDTIISISKETGIDPLLITSVIIVESEFRNVIGLDGELGMMQIKPETAAFVAKVFKIEKPEEGWIRILWDYKLNIKIGTYYIKYLYNKFGNIVDAIRHYNGGIYKDIYAERIMETYKKMLKVASSYEQQNS